MLTVKQLLTASGLETPHGKIKLVRHSGHLGHSIRRIMAHGDFDLYQAEQDANVKPFHGCEVLLSFIGIEANKAEFRGVYRVIDFRRFTRADLANLPDYLAADHKADLRERIYYELEELEDFQYYRGRLIVQWLSTRGWHQKKDLDVYEILPPVLAKPFPGYQDVVLGFEELKAIFADARAHRDWKAALKANAGIYRIVDLSSGKIYIGSAYGSDGLWGRWQTYAKTGHGGNKLLKKRDSSKFQWSIVRTLSTTMSQRDVIRIEQREKEKHGSKALGLNAN